MDEKCLEYVVFTVCFRYLSETVVTGIVFFCKQKISLSLELLNTIMWYVKGPVKVILSYLS